MELVTTPSSTVDTKKASVRIPGYSDKSLDFRTPTPSHWKANSAQLPVGVANTFMHQHCSKLQTGCSRLAVLLIFFSNDPRSRPLYSDTANFAHLVLTTYVLLNKNMHKFLHYDVVGKIHLPQSPKPCHSLLCLARNKPYKMWTGH